MKAKGRKKAAASNWPPDKEGRPWRGELRGLLGTYQADQAKGDDDHVPEHIAKRFDEIMILEALAQYEESYSDGDTLALLDAVYLCAHRKIAMPEWVAREFMARLERVGSYEAKSLDDAFGGHLPKNAKHQAKRERELKARPLYHEIRRRNVAGESLETLFETVGAEYGLSMSRARQWFYWYRSVSTISPDSYKKAWE